MRQKRGASSDSRATIQDVDSSHQESLHLPKPARNIYLSGETDYMSCAEQLKRLEHLGEAICFLTHERRSLQGALLATYQDSPRVLHMVRPPAYARGARTRNFISTFTSRQCLTTVRFLLGGPAKLTLDGAFMLKMQEDRYGLLPTPLAPGLIHEPIPHDRCLRDTRRNPQTRISSNQTLDS